MKLNWGTGIVITILIFLIISFAMIFHFMNQKVDLVTTNYYEKTLTYQEQIDEANRSKLFDEQIILTYTASLLTFSFPDSLANKIQNGELIFYRPSDSSRDFKSSFNLSKQGKIALNVSDLEKGYWKLQLKWNMNDKSYSIERTLMIN